MPKHRYCAMSGLLLMIVGLAVLSGSPVTAAPSPSLLGQEIPTGIRRIYANQSSLFTIDGVPDKLNVDVAVLDSGVDLDHPDLTVMRGVDCVDNNGNPDDEYGHGTMVAGVIGAEDNDFGVVGVVPGARIWAVRVGNGKGDFQIPWLLCGLRWVADHADTIEVANLSLGSKEAIPNLDDHNCGRTNQDPVQQEICRIVERGITVVVAAGNEQRDAALVSPAAYDEVITVSSMNDYDGLPGGNSGRKILERLVPCLERCWQ